MEPLNLKQWKEYNKATHCHICFKEFQENDTKVRDHCHYTGQYRGPAHRSCNLAYKVPKYMHPIVSHNLSGDDAHSFIRELAKEFNKGGIGGIAENKKKYFSFTIDVLVDKYKNTSGKVKENSTQIH